MRLRAFLAAWGLVALVAGPLALAVPRSALAAAVEWGIPQATSTYGGLLEFQQPVTIPVGASRVEVLLDFPGAEGPFVADVGVGVTGTSTTLAFDYDVSTGHLYPNTTVGARWRVTLADGTTEIGPQVTTTYADTSHPWKTKTGNVVRIHWYEGSDAFADRALQIGDDAIAKAASLLGVTETEPVDFFVYGSQDDFYGAAGPGTRENVGGFALPEIRTLFALITPEEIDASWVATVVPHELTHLVFDTAVTNPYHYPPRWLNEGVAVYLSEGNASDYRRDLKKGVADGRILPLGALTTQFPTTADQFFLAYAESVSAVAYIVDTYGQDALVKLIRAYADGVSDDEAFRTGLGVTLADVEAGWLASIGAAAPERAGPLPAPGGAVPSDWTGQSGTVASPAPASAPPEAASPAASPPATPRPVASAGDGSVAPGARETDAGVVLLAVAAFVAAIAAGGALALRSRERRPPAAPPAYPGAPQWPAQPPAAPPAYPGAPQWPAQPPAAPPAYPGAPQWPAQPPAAPVPPPPWPVVPTVEPPGRVAEPPAPGVAVPAATEPSSPPAAETGGSGEPRG
jgi:hypothetical protein